VRCHTAAAPSVLGSRVRAFLPTQNGPFWSDCLVRHLLAIENNQKAGRQGGTAHVADISAIHVVFPVEANSVFVAASDQVFEGLRARGWQFYTFIGGAARFMLAWDSDLGRIDALIGDIRDLTGTTSA
jgi:hypothetical protein